MKDINLKVSKQVAEGDYYTDTNDFVANHELVVTITLHEYRELVADSAKKDMTESMLYGLREDLKKAKEEAEELKKRIAELESLSEPEFTVEVPFEGEPDGTPPTPDEIKRAGSADEWDRPIPFEEV